MIHCKAALHVYFKLHEMILCLYLDFVWISNNAQRFVNIGSLRGILDQDHLHPCTLLEYQSNTLVTYAFTDTTGEFFFLLFFLTLFIDRSAKVGTHPSRTLQLLEMLKQQPCGIPAAV